MRLTLLAAALSLAAFACRSDGNNMNGDDQPGVDAPPGTSDVNIKDIQMGTVAPGTAVKLEGVIVTAIDAYGARTGDIFVQEPEGGAYSGIKVFGAPLDVVANLAVGDIVTITGASTTEYRYEPMMGTPWPEGQSLTELEPTEGGMMSITKTGTGTPVATDVDAQAIQDLPDFAARDAEWEKYEGVLITVRKARQITELTAFGMADDQKSFDATGSIEVQSAISDLGAPAIDTCYASMVGVVDYFFGYKLMPRNASDLTGGGTDCSEVAQPEPATIAEVQTGVKTGLVEFSEVYVSAIAFNKKNLWVTQSLTAAPNEGIYLFRGSNAAVLPAGIVPGAKVKVRGNVKEQNNDMSGDTVTQLDRVTVDMIAAPTTEPIPVAGQTAAQLAVEQYESILVTLTNVKVVMVGNMANFYVSQLSQGGTQFIADDDILRLQMGDADKCFATVTGIWTYQVFDNVFGLLPIEATGIGTCN